MTLLAAIGVVAALLLVAVVGWFVAAAVLIAIMRDR